MSTHPANTTQSLSPTDWLTILNECANEADTIASHYYQQHAIAVQTKSDNSPVTEADQKIEQVIRALFCNRYPDLGVVGEEFPDTNPHAAVKLIVDPIDGTSNFIRRIPIFGALLAIEVNQDIVAGVVSNGILKDRWFAAKGHGAYYNANPIRVSSVDSITEAQAFYGSLYGREARGNTAQLQQLLSHTKRQRGIGDFMMHTWVANGFGEFGIDFGLQPWDIAPLGILVEEAGGTVTAVDGSPFNCYEGSILTSNGLVHNDIVRLYNTPLS